VWERLPQNHDDGGQVGNGVMGLRPSPFRFGCGSTASFRLRAVKLHHLFGSRLMS